MTVSIILTTYTRNGFKKLQCERTFLLCQTSLVLKKGKCLSDENILVLTRFRMGIFGVAHEGGVQKGPLLLKAVTHILQ